MGRHDSKYHLSGDLEIDERFVTVMSWVSPKKNRNETEEA
jgi:hypothetical protein